VLVELTPLLLRRARQLYGDGAVTSEVLERYSVSELMLLRDFVRADCEYNERRAAQLTGSTPKRRRQPAPRASAGRVARTV
jgi:hypothetical protein